MMVTDSTKTFVEEMQLLPISDFWKLRVRPDEVNRNGVFISFVDCEIFRWYSNASYKYQKMFERKYNKFADWFSNEFDLELLFDKYYRGQVSANGIGFAMLAHDVQNRIYMWENQNRRKLFDVFMDDFLLVSGNE